MHEWFDHYTLHVFFVARTRHRSFDLPPLPHDAARCPLALEAELVGVRWPAEHQAPAAPPEALVPGQAARSNRSLG